MDSPVEIKPRQETLEVQGDPVVMNFFHPPGGRYERAVIIAGAMGVSQRFYAPLASWLAGQRLLAVTFDYRGMGQSQNRPLKDVDLNIIDWAEGDCEAVLRRVRETVGDVPISWIGHSLGGQIFPMVPSHGEVSRMVTVAAGSGYWRENVPRLRRTSWFLWFFITPLSLRLLGYFPGRRLRMIGDLPAGVMRQWRSWVLNPEYSVGVEGPEMRSRYAAVDIPIIGFSFTDDEYLSESNIDSMHGFFSGADVDLHRMDPADLGLSRVGHFGFFRAANEEPLWRPYLLPALSGSQAAMPARQGGLPGEG